MKIRAVIADDEPLARQRILTLLADQSDIEVVAECADGAATIAAVETHGPDLLFLDVQMPHVDGFGVLECLAPDALPAVIFTTAHDEHAIRAFEVHALDYLLKPFKESRFLQSIERARQHLRDKSEPTVSDRRIASLLEHLRAGQRGGPRILIKQPDRIFFLRSDQVDHIEAAGNYIVVHSLGERHIVRETMAAMEKRLGHAGFMRISRAVMVNLHAIRELQPMGASEYCVILKNGARLPMTCSLREVQQRIADL